jgi:signal transduction histidine kinase
MLLRQRLTRSAAPRLRRRRTPVAVAAVDERTKVGSVLGFDERTARILVVEADAELRGTFDLLLSASWSVTLADSAEHAWDVAQSSHFDLVISDTEAPDINGIDLVRRLRANRETQDVSVILVARGAGEHETIAGLEAGADDFLAKPFSGRELLVRVRTRLELAAMRRRNTQQEEMLTNLRRTLHARDEFFSAASHELRTPLTTLGLQTEGLLQAYGTAKEPVGSEDERLRRRLGLIRKQVVRLDQLVDQLLDISRLIEGRLDLHIEEVDFQSVALEAIDLLREPAQRAGSPILFRGTDSVVGRWDRLRLGQVVTNLLSNAIKFGRGRPIEIELAADEREAELQVRDDGEGIEQEAQVRIFERFERATTVRRHPGMGLGLWITKQIVEACHGTISVASEIGRGCAFTVKLPRAA